MVTQMSKIYNVGLRFISVSDLYLRLISGLRREVAVNFAFLGCYAASRGNFLPTFRDNLSVLSSGFKIQKKAHTLPYIYSVLGLQAFFWILKP